MSRHRLKDLVLTRKEHILSEMRRRIAALPFSPYQEFILHTEEGRRRLNIWIDLVGRSLGRGDHTDAFCVDQERVGYARAIQGFGLRDVFQVFLTFQETVWRMVSQTAPREGMRDSSFHNDIFDLNRLLLTGYDIVARSYLRTREEIITEKVEELKELYNFTHEIIINYDLDRIVKLILTRMASLFSVEDTALALYRNQRVQGIYTLSPDSTSRFAAVVEQALRESAPLFVDDSGSMYRDVEQSRIKRLVAAPIVTHSRSHGVLVLASRLKGFKFAEKEQSLLNQFIYIMAVALENAFMLEEIERSHQQLRTLTGEIISIQEEERRRLAADIHDTVAQVLAGISYKLQVLKELVKKDPRLLSVHLDGLVGTVHDATDQCRELISSLRPDLIDTMGLVPALNRLIKNFEQDTGIKVTARFPKKVRMSSEARMCVFRVAQEALMNAYKHAETKDVEISLRKKEGNLVLVVADTGKGFDLSTWIPWVQDQKKLGLLSMKERVEALGGTFSVKAEMNRGCHIEARIPSSFEVRGNASDQGDDRR
jgi:signal transduction histidine kinase